jgi:hypothetical protein
MRTCIVQTQCGSCDPKACCLQCLCPIYILYGVKAIIAYMCMCLQHSWKYVMYQTLRDMHIRPPTCSKTKDSKHEGLEIAFFCKLSQIMCAIQITRLHCSSGKLVHGGICMREIAWMHIASRHALQSRTAGSQSSPQYKWIHTKQLCMCPST